MGGLGRTNILAAFQMEDKSSGCAKKIGRVNIASKPNMP
jgi:hypothetical protein